MSEIYSLHTFMFPFRWDKLHKGFKISDIKENISFEHRTDLSKIEDNFGEWQRKKFIFTEDGTKLLHENYNEFTYFHEFVQKAIYDYDYPWKKDQEIVKYYEYKIEKHLDNEYIISYMECDITVTLTLKIDGISLHLFNTGVGILTYNLSNVNIKQKSFEHILKINEYGRRMYPQFCGKDGIKNAQGVFLPKELQLKINSRLKTTTSFKFYEEIPLKIKPSEPYQLPEHIRELFSEKFIFAMTENPLDEEKILITKVTDDRMFFLSWYGDEFISRKIGNKFKTNGDIEDNWMYAFIFGDKAIKNSIANLKMNKKQLEKHTYRRWIEWKTIYGISRDSFVCLTDEGDFTKDNILVAMQTMYYAISVLCLAQRASILKFTAEVANLADLAKIENEKDLVTNIKEVYKNYIEFVNKLYFREVTSQIQGIELYNQFQKLMNIEKEINNMDKEINELHQYVSLLQETKRSEQAEKLNLIAAIFLPATIMFGILGSNFLESNNFYFQNGIDGHKMLWILIGFLPSILVLIFLKLKK